jgi:hypothetical protein
MTITPSAARYQTVQASLLNSAGKFVAPSTFSLIAAETAMTATTENSNVYEYNFDSSQAKKAQNAYPLATPIYAALNPTQSDSTSRAVYANLIRYAVEKGQTLGTNLGQLPLGYAPISNEFKKIALSAADAIENGVSPIAKPDNGGTQVPVVQPTTKPVVIAAGVTPKDPSVAISAAAVPLAGALFICAFMFYVLLRQRKSSR